MFQQARNSSPYFAAAIPVGLLAVWLGKGKYCIQVIEMTYPWFRTCDKTAVFVKN